MSFHIRFGVCCSPEQVPVIQRLGYDYAEFGLAWLSALSEEKYKAVREGLHDGKYVEAVNGLLPGSLRLTDASFSPVACRDYLRRAFDRAAPLGVQIAVFGSGVARCLPDTNQARGRGQLVEFGGILGEVSKDYGILSVVEPLNRGECNVLNSVSEGVEYAKRVNSPNVRVLADLYHVVLEHEPISDIVEAGELLRHCHIANPDGRVAPAPGDAYSYAPFFHALKTIAYDGRVSCEGNWKNFEAEAARALPFLRSFCD